MYLFLLEEIGSWVWWWWWDDEVKERLEERGNCLSIPLEEPPNSSDSSEEFAEEFEVERRLMIEDLMSGVSSPG
jgi:hypothetical protein